MARNIARGSFRKIHISMMWAFTRSFALVMRVWSDVRPKMSSMTTPVTAETARSPASGGNSSNGLRRKSNAFVNAF